MNELTKSLWSSTSPGDAMEALARRSGLAPSNQALPGTKHPVELGAIDGWMMQAAEHLQVEATNVTCTTKELGAFLSSAAPALLHVPRGDGAGWLALLASGRRYSEAIGPDGHVRRISHAVLRECLCEPIVAPLRAEIDAIVERVAMGRGARESARQALLDARIGSSQVAKAWVLRPLIGAGFWRHVRHARLPGPLGGFLLAHLALVGCTGSSWWLVGRGALEGHLEHAWLVAWALLVMTMVPVGAAAAWLRGKFALRIGCLVKQWLLVGALRLDTDALRHEGAGRSLSRVVESSALGSLALASVLAGVVSVFELGFAAWVLSMGAGGAFHVLLLLLWLAVSVLSALRYHRTARAWTACRMELTHELVERMSGHRTRLAQEDPARWHEGEDEALERYQALSELMDRASLRFTVWIPRGWLLLGILGLWPAFVHGDAHAGGLAVALGGVMLASQALGTVAGALTSLTSALLSWEQAAVLLRAAAPQSRPGSMLPLAITPAQSDERQRVVLEADNLVYSYPSRAEPVLRGCSLSLREGDRILLQGASGSGKSTLVSVLSGLRAADSGLLLLGGLDQQSIGADAWRRRVVVAPQFHENHLMTATLSFNLLMGRCWPPSKEDLAEADAVCRELGLGELLDRMPAGLNQVVGETGWRLSHGEMSRVFLARGILQGGDVLLFDESFAALDPVNLERGLRCAIARARTLVVVAHP